MQTVARDADDQSSDEDLTNGETNHTTLPNGNGMKSDIGRRMEALKKYGKESRHNVISRKDNLVLSPDQSGWKVNTTHHASQRVAIMRATTDYALALHVHSLSTP